MFVKAAVSLALDRNDREREMTAQLLVALSEAQVRASLAAAAQKAPRDDFYSTGHDLKRSNTQAIASVLNTVSRCAGFTAQVLSPDALAGGFTRLLVATDDTVLDVPDAVT